MGLFDQILERRNPYLTIAQKAQETAQRRAGQAPQQGQQAPPPDPLVEEGPQRPADEAGRAPLSRENSVESRIQDNISNSRQIQQQQRADERRAQIRESMSALQKTNRENTNSLSPLGLQQSSAQRLQGLEGVQSARVTGQNGRLDTSQLVDVDGRGNYLTPVAASAWQRMVADAARDGITIGIGNSYRDYDSQVRVAQEKGLYSEGGLAAEPGTSNHGWGLAVDVTDNPGEREWLAANAGRYGFHTIPREPWHWEYRS